MGQSQSIQKINFQDIQYILKNKDDHILINTLNENRQDCLIIGTIGINKEVEIINNCIKIFLLVNKLVEINSLINWEVFLCLNKLY